MRTQLVARTPWRACVLGKAFVRFRNQRKCHTALYQSRYSTPIRTAKHFRRHCRLQEGVQTEESMKSASTRTGLIEILHTSRVLKTHSKTKKRSLDTSSATRPSKQMPIHIPPGIYVSTTCANIPARLSVVRFQANQS